MSTLKVTNITPQSGDTVYLTGSLEVSDVLIAREIRTELTQSSVLFQSGSTKFGDSIDDVHQFTGSINFSGSLFVSGAALFENVGNISQSIYDLNQADLTFSSSAATALRAEYVAADTALSSSAHISRTELSSSAHDQRITINTGQTDALNTYTSSNDNRVAGIEAVTGSYATTSSLQILIDNTGSYATTSSLQILIDNTGSYATTSSLQELIDATGSYATTGSNTFTENQIVSSSALLTLEPVIGLAPIAATGSLMVSGSPAQLYIYNGSGSGWNRV